MNYEKFKEMVINFITKELKMKTEPVIFPKNNGVKLDGVAVFVQENMGANIYLEGYYDEFKSGIFTFEEICEKIKKNIFDTADEAKEFEKKNLKFCDFKSIKDKIVFCVINAARNEELLKSVAHTRFLDLAIIYRIQVKADNRGIQSMLIQNNFLNVWGVTTEELFKWAKLNTPLLRECKIQKLSDMTGIPLPYNVMMLTNKFSIDGAATMLYPELLQAIADKAEDDLVIIPSSVHEILIYPNSQVEKEMINEMIVSVNEEAVDEKDVLSDHTYFYHRLLKQIEM